MDPVDALATSPFALLDAHGSLRLVTDAAHEDDALCLALTCRALRNVLWARFPVRPAGHAHAGKRLRTRDAAVAKLGAAVTADGVLRVLKTRLRALPAGIGRLVYLPEPGLKKLNLSFDGRLGHANALPEGLWSLVGLEELTMMACNLRALPEGIGGLAGLRKLDLRYNGELVALPAGLCSLAGLEVLHLSNCPGLRALPEGIGGLAGLRTLDLSYNTGLTALPAGLGRLRNLHTLIIAYGCPGLAALSDLQRREGLPALVAHLAAQGQPPVAAEVSYPVA
jgi:hypothetical protein